MLKNTIVAIISVVVVIVVVVAFLSFNQKETATKQPATVSDENTTLPDSTVVKEETQEGHTISVDASNWLTYRDEKRGYEIKHPRDVVVVDESAGTKFLPPAYQGCPPPRGDLAPHECPLFMFIMVKKADPEKSLDGWLREELARFWGIQRLKEFKITAEESNYGLDCIEKTTIGKDIQAWKMHSWSQAWGEWEFYTKNLDRVVIIQTGNVGMTCDDPIDPLFTQMLSTFRFLR